MVRLLAKFYDFLEKIWYHEQTEKVGSKLLVGVLVLGLLIVSSANYLGFPNLPEGINYFFAIDLAFQVLLLIEILGLIFVLPRSVADSVGKQFEILSVILLRSAFKEFGYFEQPVEWSNLIYDPLYHMLSDAFGALVIFLIIGFYYKEQRHTRITRNADEQKEFIVFKKILALILFFIFLYLRGTNLFEFFQTGYYDASFNKFYTVLIFTDILILLYSLRYSSRYYNLFRYSSFALATILIRISLTAPPYVNVLIGVAAGLFVLGLTYIYNYFKEKNVIN